MPRSQQFSLLVRALRPYQWVKNALIFLPLILAHELDDRPKLVAACTAFIAFCLCASAGYVLNDLFDREADRKHPKKAQRPFASGQLSVTTGIALVVVTAGLGLCIALVALPGKFALTLVVYLLLTLAYTLYIKRKLMLDVIVLAGLYTLRVVAGAFAIEVFPTAWLLAFSTFFFLSLAFAKRYVELMRVRDAGEQERIQGRGYKVHDIDIIESVGPASGYLSVLVLSLYINGEIASDLYDQPNVLWLVCPILLYWITRIWFLARRRELNDDPILFALRDKVSWIAVILTGALVFLASVRVEWLA